MPGTRTTTKRRKVTIAIIKKATIATAMLFALPAIVAEPALAVVSQTTQDNDDAIDFENEYSNVVRIKFNRLNPMTGEFELVTGCTGLLINSRTVITARHCAGFMTDDLEQKLADGTLEITAVSQGVAPGDDFNTTSISDAIQTDGAFETVPLLDPVTGGPIINPVTGEPESMEKLGHDFLILALEKPLDVDARRVLLSPLEGEHIGTFVGYGQSGDVSVGRQVEPLLAEIRALLEVAMGDPANLSPVDFARFVELDGQIQALLAAAPYDFKRVGKNVIRVDTDAVGLSSLQAYQADFDADDGMQPTDLYDDSLPGEMSVASGDSGGPLFVDLDGEEYFVGVVSGGDQQFPTPGGVMVWTGLFNYYKFLEENTPYKYVGAREGTGNWSDPSHWEQLLDPSFYRLDENGNAVNGIPTHQVFDNEGNPFTQDLGRCSLLRGEGSTGFVPNNTHGLHTGEGFKNCAQYFDVTLSNPGFTTADINVTIDKLKIDHQAAALKVDETREFTTLLDATIDAGMLTVDGSLTTRNLINAGGVVGGSGSITTAEFLNAGMIVPGGAATVGSLIVNGNVTMLSNSIFAHDRIDGLSDLLAVNGDTLLNGTLALNFGADGPTYKDNFTVLESTGQVAGKFSSVTELPGVLHAILDYGETDTGEDSVSVFVDAGSFNDLLSPTASKNLTARAGMFDAAREKSYDTMRDYFTPLDQLEGDDLVKALRTTQPEIAVTSTTAFLMTAESIGGQLQARSSEIANGSRFAGSGMASISVASNDGSDAFALLAASAAESGVDNSKVIGDGWTVFNQFSRMKGEVNALSESESDAYVTTFGIDKALSKAVTLGGFVSYHTNETFLSDVGQAADGDGYILGGHGLFLGENWQLGGHFGIGFSQFDTVRIAQAGNVKQKLTGSTDALSLVSKVTLSKTVWLGDHFVAVPEIALNVTDFRVNGYTEHGGSTALQVDDFSLTSMQASVGADIYFTPREAITPFFGGRLIYDIGDDSTSALNDFASNGFSGATTFTGVDRDKEFGQFRTGFSIDFGNELVGNFIASKSIGRDDLDYYSWGIELNGKF